jgi:hypothetical protein
MPATKSVKPAVKINETALADPLAGLFRAGRNLRILRKISVPRSGTVDNGSKQQPVTVKRC